MIIRIWLVTILVLGSGLSMAHTSEQYEINPEESRVDASIKYVVIGNYLAHIEKFKGQIQFESDKNELESVFLQFNTASLNSTCSRCDRIVLSSRILDVAQYPTITFRSTSIRKVSDGWIATGLLSLHGVTKELTFPFNAHFEENEENGRMSIAAKGKWTFNRKLFNVIWHKTLDKGGIFVGNKVTIDWEILAQVLD